MIERVYRYEEGGMAALFVAISSYKPYQQKGKVT